MTSPMRSFTKSRTNFFFFFYSLFLSFGSKILLFFRRFLKILKCERRLELNREVYDKLTQIDQLQYLNNYVSFPFEVFIENNHLNVVYKFFKVNSRFFPVFLLKYSLKNFKILFEEWKLGRLDQRAQCQLE